MLIFTENRNQFNPLMQKIAIFAAAAALLASCAPARKAFVINGNIQALPDSTEILLYSVRDDGLMQVVDTALSENGKFVLECAPDSAQELSIVARSFGSSLLTVYAEPGAKAGISGDAGNVMLWKVRSRVPEQREYNRYLENVWTEIGEQARLREESDSLGNMLYGMDDRGTDEAKALQNLVRKCREREDSVVKVRYDKTLDLLAASKVSRISTEELSGIIRMIGYYPEKYGELRDRAAEQYERLSDEVKASPEGRDMKAFLSVTDRVKVGDRFFDGEFRDLDGGTHRLSDYLGKYILLDFWAFWCGPCRMSMPELKSLAEQYGDRVNFISLSEDPDEQWREASEEHGISWNNFNYGDDLAFKLTYDVSGIPSYFIISPEGVIVDSWAGYSEGVIRERLGKFL